MCASVRASILDILCYIICKVIECNNNKLDVLMLSSSDETSIVMLSSKTILPLWIVDQSQKRFMNSLEINIPVL